MNASSDRLLRRTLWGNAVFSVDLGRRAGGLRRAVRRAGRPCAGVGGGPRPRHRVRAAGPGRGAFGALCAWVASRETLPRAWARVIFAADIAWVAGSVLVLALPATWTTAGIAGIVVVALIVADIAILEYLGLRRLGAAH